MKTYIADDSFEKVVIGEWTWQQWMEQAKEGPEYDVSEDELELAIENDLREED